jgi:putative transposase
MNSRISTKLQTREHRKTMFCQVFQVKVDRSKLSEPVLKHLNKVFNEAKWLYNYILSQENIGLADTTVKTVPVKTPDCIEYRNFEYLSSQMKQSIKERIFNNLKALSALKKNGTRVGKLKFRSFLDSIPLKQYKVTYTVSEDRKYIKLQGLKHRLKVNGLEQIPLDSEIASAMLVRKCGDFYFHISTYTNNKKLLPPELFIGIDFGCDTQLTLRNGIKIEFLVPVDDKIKVLDRKIMKKKRKKSNNKWKDQCKRRKAYNHLKNKKKEIRNKVVNVLTTYYRYVIVQDESIKAWQASNHGKKINGSAIGGVISDLKQKSHTPVVVNKFFPSTQLCPQCNQKNKLEVSDRVYECSCGYKEDRDVKSALMIEREGKRMLGIVPTDCREVKLQDRETTACVYECLKSIHGIRVSFSG